jgi:hypothetical protein
MIDDCHRLCHYDIPLNVNIVFGGNETSVTDLGVVIKHNHGSPFLLRWGEDFENGIFLDLDRIAKLDSVRSGPSQITGIMNGQIVTIGRKRIG